MTESIERCDFQIKLTLFYFCFVFVLNHPSSTIGFQLAQDMDYLLGGLSPKFSKINSLILQNTSFCLFLFWATLVPAQDMDYYETP